MRDACLVTLNTTQEVVPIVPLPSPKTQNHPVRGLLTNTLERVFNSKSSKVILFRKILFHYQDVNVKIFVKLDFVFERLAFHLQTL